jgi:hypothetical protein
MGFTPEQIALHEAGFDDPYRWKMIEPLRWNGEFRNETRTLTVPATKLEPFTTDLASVPRSLTWLFPRYGKYTKAAVVHDFLCQSFRQEPDEATANALLPLIDRSDADELFRGLMKELGVPKLRRTLMWTAVSWGTLFTSLTVGRESRKVQRAVGIGLVIAGIVGAGALLVAQWTWWSLVIAAIGLTAVVLVAGTTALGRASRIGAACAVYPLTLFFSPFILLGMVIALVLVAYLLFEDALEGFSGIRALLKSLTKEQRMANLATPRGARIIAMRAS